MRLGGLDEYVKNDGEDGDVGARRVHMDVVGLRIV